MVIMVGFWSCEEEKGVTDLPVFKYELKSEIPYDLISKREKGFKGTNGSTALLIFPDIKSLTLTMNDLDRQINELDSAFVSFYSNLTTEELNDKEVEINFSSYKPIIDFNNYFLHYSLYQEIATKEEEWLNNETLDNATDPDNHFVLEYALRSVLNTDCEVQIGDSIYKLVENGYYSIPAAKLELLQIIENKTNISNYPEIRFISNDGVKGDCETGKTKFSFKKVGDYRIKWLVGHHSFLTFRKVVAKTDNYYKKGNRWKKYRVLCIAQVYGFISGNGDCSTQLNFNPNGYFEYDIAKHVEHKIDVQTKTKSGWVKGYFAGANNISHTATLTW